MSTVSSSTITTGAGVSSSQDLTAAQQAQIAKDLQALSDALKTNNVKAAEAAMIKLQQDSSASSTAASSGTQGQGASDLSAVATALNNGDLSGAQNAFATFEGNAAHAHGHKHHGKPGAAEAADTTPQGASFDSATPSTADELTAGSSFSYTV